MSLNCSIYGCKERCFLAVQLKNQSKTGGGETKTSQTGAGPYWQEPNWTGFVKNTLDLAQQGCPEANELAHIARTITEQKRVAGEILEG